MQRYDICAFAGKKVDAQLLRVEMIVKECFMDGLYICSHVHSSLEA